MILFHVVVVIVVVVVARKKPCLFNKDVQSGAFEMHFYSIVYSLQLFCFNNDNGKNNETMRMRENKKDTKVHNRGTERYIRVRKGKNFGVDKSVYIREKSVIIVIIIIIIIIIMRQSVCQCFFCYNNVLSQCRCIRHLA